MGCNGCGGIGHDPYAAYRNKGGRRMGRGSSQGVIKSEKRLKREAKAKAEAEKPEAEKSEDKKEKGKKPSDNGSE